MPSLETKNFGLISYGPGSEIDFPRGLPGFENRRQFLALQFEHAHPLIFLQSMDDSNLCFITAPVPTIDPQYRLSMSEEDQQLIGLPVGPTPQPGNDVVCLAVISLHETGPTANLLAPVVINVNNFVAVQAVSQESHYPHQHVLTQTEALAVCS